MQLMRSPTAVAPGAAAVRALSSRKVAQPTGRAATFTVPRWAAPQGQLRGFAAGSWLSEQGPESQAAAPAAWPGETSLALSTIPTIQALFDGAHRLRASRPVLPAVRAQGRSVREMSAQLPCMPRHACTILAHSN